MSWGDTLKDAWNGATTAAKDAANAIGRGVETAADWTVDKAVKGWDYTSEKAVQAWDYTSEKAVQAWDYTSEKAVQAWDYTSEKAVQAWDWTSEKAVQGWNWTSEKAAQGWDWTKQAGIDVYRGAVIVLGKGVAGLGGALNVWWKDLKKEFARASDHLIDVYNEIADLFGWDPIDAISEASSCACGSETDGAFVKDGCVTTDDADAARADPVRPDAGNTCCDGVAGKRTIFYVNGIKTDLKTHCATLQAIANSTCADVVGIYNATEGMVPDGLQTFGDRALIEQAASGKHTALDGRNPAVDTVSDMVYGEVLAGRPPPEIWAHSQGGAVTSLGLYSANNRLEAAGVFGGLDGMKVKSFGSAAPRWVQGPNYEHYVHINDATPVIFGLGADAANDPSKAGGGSVIRFAGRPGELVREGPKFKRTGLELTDNHEIDSMYVPMQEQIHGGCGGHAAAP